MRNSRIKRRVHELLSKAATVHQEKSNDDRKELHFVFFRKPTRFLPSEDGTTVGAVELEKTLLKGYMSGVYSIIYFLAHLFDNYFLLVI
jgi:adrenodoxin-NADP+ reductase